MQRYNKVPKQSFFKKLHCFFQKPTHTDMYLLFTELAIFEEAGITAADYIVMASEAQSNIVLKKALQAINYNITTGMSIAHAFAQTGVFEQFVIGILSLSNEAAQMAAGYEAIANHYERQGELKSKIDKAFFTPKIGFFLMIVGCVFFAKILIPKYVEMFSNNDLIMPAFVTVFAWVINAIVDNFPTLCLVFFLLYKYILRFINRHGRYIDRLLLKTPIYGPLYHNQLQQLLASNIHLMLKSGRDLSASLEYLIKIIPSASMREALSNTLRLTLTGTDADKAFISANKNHVYSDTTINLIKAGTAAGSLVLIFEKIAKIYEIKINKLLGVMETKLTIIAVAPLGLMILFFYYISLLPAMGYIEKINR